MWSEENILHKPIFCLVSELSINQTGLSEQSAGQIKLICLNTMLFFLPGRAI